MQCPPWLWRLLLKRYWPNEFLEAEITKGIGEIDRRWPGLPISDDSPIFILAAGWRSGSTLVQRLLNSHPNVLIWGEAYEYTLLLYHLLAPLKIFAREELELSTLVSNMGATPATIHHSLTMGWIANLTPRRVSLKQAHWAFLEALFKIDAVSLGRPRWGLKMVRATATVGYYLKWLYPNARFIYLFRNPYNAFRSYVNRIEERGHPWYLYYPKYEIGGALSFSVHWRQCMDSFFESQTALQAFLLPYEKLVTREILPSLLDYLDMELDLEPLNARVDIAKQNRRELRASERSIIRFVAGERATQLGYFNETQADH